MNADCIPDDWVILRGKVVEGYRVASGTASDSPYPRGSIEMQVPFFRELGVDLSGFHFATLNVSVAPLSVSFDDPRYVLRAVRWSPDHDPENFSLSPCRVAHGDAWHDGYVYYPHEETKQRHHHDASIIEIITSFLAGVQCGDSLEVLVHAHEITVR